ncbi:hypothetical protein NX059_002797 [Plenodomus lindquistii]|nr:hypothetical protein NX059_002797 [Plenodomus lindquistii]
MSFWHPQQQQRPMQQQQVGPWGLPQQPQPLPIQQAQMLSSPQLRMQNVPTSFQHHQHYSPASPSPPGPLGWSERATQYSNLAHYYGTSPAQVQAMARGHQNAPRKRSADSLTTDEMPTPKRQAIAAPITSARANQGSPITSRPMPHSSPHNRPQAIPTPPPSPLDPACLAWAREMVRVEYQQAASQGKLMSQQQQQQRLRGLYAHALQAKRSKEEKEREEQARLAQIEIQRKEDEDKKKKQAAAAAAAEQLRIQQLQERDRLARIQLAQAKEKAHQEEERKKAASAAAAAEKQRREDFQRAEAAKKQRAEAAQIEAAAALERQRKEQRKAELKSDPNRNFHSFLECLEFWPLDKGDRPDPYLKRLMANQRMPMAEDSDTAIAIKWARKNWFNYREYPRDVSYCVRMAKVDEEKAKAAEEKPPQPPRPSWMG